MAVTKRTRFEVLRRDNHTCRYCGASAPDATLTVDHVIPVALGGTDDPTNLVAACRACNAGKSSTSPDASLVADVSNEALRWRKAVDLAAELAARDRAAHDASLSAFHERWHEWTYGGGKYHFSLPGDWEPKVRQVFIDGLTVPEVCEAVDLAIRNKSARDEFAYFLGICKQKIAQRQAVARALMDRGEV